MEKKNFEKKEKEGPVKGKKINEKMFLKLGLEQEPNLKPKKKRNATTTDTEGSGEQRNETEWERAKRREAKQSKQSEICKQLGTNLRNCIPEQFYYRVNDLNMTN